MTQTQLASMFLGKPHTIDDIDNSGANGGINMIHIVDGQTHEILDYITLDNIIEDNHKKSLENTLETYDAIVLGDKRYNEHLEKRNRVIIPDEDGTLREFVLFEIDKYRDTEGLKTHFYSHASYLELKKANIVYPDKHESLTASQLAGIALNETGWTVGIIEAEGSRTIEIENHTNPYEFLKRIANEFDVELRFRIEHNGRRITGRYVDLLEQIGEWRGREIEFGRDLDGIRRVEEQDIVTALLGIGPEKEDGTRIEVLVEDEDALRRWGRVDEYGELHHLIEPYEIQSDNQEMTKEEARQYTRTALDKRINTQVSYETTVVDLENVPGMENKKIRFGDTIRIKDTEFNPPLYLEARVYEMTRSIKSKAKKELKLGEYVEFTEEEVHAIWQQLRDEIRARIKIVNSRINKTTLDAVKKSVTSNKKSMDKRFDFISSNDYIPDDIYESLTIADSEYKEISDDIVNLIDDAGDDPTREDVDEVNDLFDDYIEKMANLAEKFDTALDAIGTSKDDEIWDDLESAQEEIDDAKSRLEDAEKNVEDAQNLIDSVTDDRDDKTVLSGTLVTNEIIAEDGTITGDLDGDGLTFSEGTFENITAVGATFEDSTITGTLDALNAQIVKGTFEDITAVGATFKDSTVKGTLNALDAKIVEGTFEDITAVGGTFENIEAVGGKFDGIEATDAIFEGELKGAGGTFTGTIQSNTIDTNEIEIGYESIANWENTSAKLKLKNIIRITDDEFYEGDPFEIEVGNNDAKISIPRTLEIESDGLNVYGWIFANDFVYTDAVDVRSQSAHHVYIRPKSYGNVRITTTGTSDDWRPIEASGFENRSQAELKQDIELWDESALDIINQADIYQYRLISDAKNGIDKLKYGLVIGEGYNTPNEFLTAQGESVDIYVQTNINTKAIQELSELQQGNKDDIKYLEKQVQELKQKMEAK